MRVFVRKGNGDEVNKFHISCPSLWNWQTKNSPPLAWINLFISYHTHAPPNNSLNTSIGNHSIFLKRENRHKHENSTSKPTNSLFFIFIFLLYFLREHLWNNYFCQKWQKLLVTILVAKVALVDEILLYVYKICFNCYLGLLNLQ